MERKNKITITLDNETIMKLRIFAMKNNIGYSEILELLIKEFLN